MPFKLNWKKVNEFENEKNLDLFLLTNVQTSTGKSNTVIVRCVQTMDII